MTILKFGPKRIIGLEHLERASSNQSRSETTTMARQIPEEFRRSSSFQDLTTMPGPCLIAILSGFFFLQKLDHCSNLYPNSLQTDIQPNVKFWKRPTLNTDSPELRPLCFWTGFSHLDSLSSEIPKVLRIQMFIWPAFSPRTPEAQSLRLSESRISSSICRVPVWLAIVCSSVEMKSLLEPVTVPRTDSASGTTLQKQQQRQRHFFLLRLIIIVIWGEKISCAEKLCPASCFLGKNLLHLSIASLVLTLVDQIGGVTAVLVSCSPSDTV